MSCSSGRVGVGYEGDICNFTCNTNYELSGSDTRTCQSDGSWSGTDDVCRRGMFIYYTIYQANIMLIFCVSLHNPNNEVINLFTGSSGVTSLLLMPGPRY